jgi:probable HAF family extracellular repeat protein
MLFVFLAAAQRRAHAQGTYTQIDVPGALYTRCYGVNTKGDIVGEYEDGSGVEHGFLLSDGVFTNIDDPGWSETFPAGINDGGQVVGSLSNDLAESSFLYDSQSGLFSEISYPGATTTYANGINSAGDIIGYYTVQEAATNGFELSGSAYTEISPSDRVQTQALGITAGGSVVGVVNGQFQYDFGFYDGKFKNLNLPSGLTLMAVNPQGSVLAGVFLGSRGYTGWAYRNKKYIFISFPGSTETMALGINHADEIVGWFIDSGNKSHCFRWNPPSEATTR